MTAEEMPADKTNIDAALVRRLVDRQFPQWADLPIRPVAFGGWDNRTFHLGDAMTVRLPSAATYALQVEKEQRWLPRLAPLLPLPIPAPLAMGKPGEGFPWPWSIYRWIDGDTATLERIADLNQFAVALAEFLAALQRSRRHRRTTARPAQFLARRTAAFYDGETRAGDRLARRQDRRRGGDRRLGGGAGRRLAGAPVWFHGDIATAICWSRTASSAPSSISARRASAIPHATSTSPGHSSTATAARRSARCCRSTTRPGRAAAAGRCGRR